jgi:predicted NBD/HSP70 family sugar kinase
MNTTVDLRKKNTLITLKAIIDSGSITKVDVAAKTGLTLMTVNTIMNNLLEKDIITDCGIADSNSGRKATLYAVNPSFHNIIGIDIGVGAVTLGISDLNLKTKETLAFEVNNNNSPEETINIILKSLLELMKNHKINAGNVLGIGITVPGPVNETSGVIQSLPNLKGWDDVTLKDIFENNLGIPVFVEKDNYASALYLKRKLGSAYKNVVALTIKGGIGTGILLKGSLYRGENGIAGEMGHVSVDVDGPRCNCGNFGCLEVYASDFAIVKDVKKSIKNGEKSSVLSKHDYNIDSLDIGRIIKAAADGDELCLDTVFRAAKYIGIAVSNALKFYDPGYFVINSRWIKEIDGVSRIITDIVKEKCTLIQRDRINLIFIYEEDVYLKGAMMLVGEHVLENTVNNRLIG